uniref:C2H2-type domain-containing protein n=1 Tax=Stomoxys calcitrans TaxID=35570 RepID=A0A1I8PZE0_STOCA
MLNMEWERRLQYVCGKCWQHISGFHQFQESIIEAQKEQHLNREVAKEVEDLKLKSALNLSINQQEIQLKLHNAKGLSARTQDLINATALAFDIKTEETLDLNNDYKAMSSQDGQHHLTHEEISLMSHMSSRKETTYLINDNESNEDYSSNDYTPLSSIRQTSVSSTDKKVTATKKSAEEFDAQVALWRSSLECEICHQLVPSYSQLKEHFSKFHASEVSYLMCCQLRLETRYDIEQHIRYHNAPQQLKCETCCKAYRWVKTLRNHNRIVHTSKGGEKNAPDSSEKLEGKYRCCKCSKDFPSGYQLDRHNQNVHKPKTLKCNLCEKSFVRPEVLREHLAGHKGEKTYVCSVCPKAFTWRPNFCMHMKKYHPQEWQNVQNEEAQREPKCGYWREFQGNCMVYICVYCFKEYDKRISIYKHIRRCHGSDGPIESKKGFRLETREKSKVHVCIYCSKEFEKRHSMYLHLKQCHRGGSLAAERASMISEPLVSAENVEIEPEWNKNQQEVQLELHNAKRLRASNEDRIKPTALTFDIKSEDPLDLDIGDEAMMFQALDQSTDEEMSLMPQMSSQKQNTSLTHEDESNVDGMSSSLGQTNLTYSENKVPSTKIFVEEEQREHVAGHKGEKTHDCSFCPQAFTWRSSFYAHVKKDHPQEWQEIQNEELQRKRKCGYWREFRGNCLVYICIYCFKEYDKRISIYTHIRRSHGSVRPIMPKREFRTETRLDLKVYVCNHCATEHEKLDSMYHHLNQYHKIDGSIAEKASTISESQKKVEIKLELNTNQQEIQLKCHNVKAISARNENLIKPKARTCDIKSEEPLDLNSDYEEMSFQVKNQLMDAKMSYMSSRNSNNDVVSNEDYSLNEVMPLPSSDKKLSTTKRSVEEFDEMVAMWRSSLECDICYQLVTSYSQLQEHFSKNHTSEICYLMCCQLRLETRFDIDRHVRYHNAPQQLKCEACCKSYTSDKQLKDHKRQVHTSKGGDKNAKSKDIEKLEGKYRCCKCSKGFASEKHLHVHNQNVHKPKTLECNFCEKSFRRPASLRDHLAGHRGEKMHACFFCPKAYTWRDHCCQHMSKSHPDEWKKMQKEEVQRESKCGYRRETRGESMVFVCIYCFKEYDNRYSMYYHAKRCQKYNTPVEPKKGYRLEARGKSKVHVCIYCAKEYEKRHSMYQHLNQCHRDDGSLVEEQASMISEFTKPDENVEIKPELNKNPEESQQNWHNATSSENLIKPKAFTFDIKTEEPWDLNNDYKRMSPQGLDQLTDEEISLMSYMSSKNENSYLKNDDASNENYGANDGMPLSSLGQTKLPASKMSVEDFDELVALWRSCLKCEICHQLVASYSQLKEHFSKYHASEGCYLMCCQLRLKTCYDIEQHIYYHNASQQLKCEACCKAFRLEKHLRDHKRQFHTSTGGDKNGKDIQRLKGKCRIMKGYRREIRGKSMVYVCLYCSSEYDKQYSIYGHLKHCQRDYDGQIKLKKGFRLEIREEGKVYVCIFCYKEYEKRISILNHIRGCRRDNAQTDPKKGYRFESRGESMVYVCNYCSKEFEKRLAMYKHIRRCHAHVMPIEPRKGYRREIREEDSMVYVCIFCSKEYANRQSMYYHLYHFHRDETSLAKQTPIISELAVPKTTEVSNITTNGDSLNELSKEDEGEKEYSLMTELKDENVTEANVKNEQFSANTNALGNEEKNEPEFEDAVIKSQEEFIEL